MLLARFITAVIALAAVLIVLFVLPASVIPPVVLLVVSAAAWEWSALAQLTSIPLRAAYALGIVGLCTWLWLAPPDQYFGPLLGVSAIWWLCAFIAVTRYPARPGRWLAVIGGVLTLVPTFVFLKALAFYPNTGAITGPALLLFVLVSIWGTDVGGYFAGKYLGKRKLSPHVSPNKTWAGVIGGLMVCALVGLVGSALFDLAWFRLVPLCVATGIVSIVGDLTVSLFKREAGLKDSGVLFPGHGGVLDRIDSIAAGTPVFVAGIFLGHGAW
ncbi:MAG: phosphatidate cytidylyltransferase [Pseudomonadota bacterium]